ncbi:MAG: ABC transporter permease [Hymenobacter sp.]
MEVMLSSVKPFDLMMGKIVGMAAVGLTQFLLWGLLSSGHRGGGAAAGAGKDEPPDGSGRQPYRLRRRQRGAARSSAIADDGRRLGRADEPGQAGAGGQRACWRKLISSISPLGLIAFGFVVYFLGGYLLYGALFGAVGAAVDDQTDTQQFMFPITMPLILSYILGFSVILRNPDGPVAFWMSMIPFTSPVAMVIRAAFWRAGLAAGAVHRAADSWLYGHGVGGGPHLSAWVF